MNILLAALTTFTLSAPPALAPVATKSIANETNASTSWLAPTSMENLQKSVNADYLKKVGREIQWAEDMPQTIQRKYSQYFGGKTGRLDVLSVTPKSEVVEDAWYDFYANYSSEDWTFKTKAYSQEISHTATFAINLNEHFDVAVNTNFMFGDTKVNADLSSQRTWLQTKTIKDTISTPSVDFTVKSMWCGFATYKIKSGIYDVKAMLRYQIPLDGKSGFDTSLLYPTSQSNPLDYPSNLYTYEDIIHNLDDAGYGDLIKLRAKDFSIVSTEDVKNPLLITFNIPVNYVSHGGRIETNFFQEPLV